MASSSSPVSAPVTGDLFLAGVTPRVRVLPVVYFSILDHYARREDSQGMRVIGTLLGSVTGSTIDVTNSFAVPHSETEDVKVDMEHHNTMLELHQRVNPNERIVGWYATGGEVTSHSVLIHDFYMRESSTNPVHLCIDASLKKGKISISAFVSNPMGTPDGTQGSMFVPVECTIFRDATERIALECLSSTLGSQTKSAPLISDLDHVSKAIDNLQNLLSNVVAYVEGAMNGGPANPEIGHFLMDTISAVPKIDPAQFEKLFQNTLQDLLMVTYLANLTRTQIVTQTQLYNVLQ